MDVVGGLRLTALIRYGDGVYLEWPHVVKCCAIWKQRTNHSKVL